MNSKTTTLAAILALAGLIVACQPKRKGVRVSNRAATAQITLQNLEAQDQNKANWAYELSGCVSPVTGVLQDSTMVEFTAVGLRSNMICQLRVKTAAPSPDLLFNQGEENVLYWDREVELTLDAAGNLVGQADLFKLYAVKPPIDPTSEDLLTVTMAGLDSKDQNQVTYTYELSACINPAVNGSLGANNTVAFKTPGMTAGLSCEFRVKHANPPSSLVFTEGETQVLYRAQNVEVSTADAGSFIATATLEKLYKIDNTVPSNDLEVSTTNEGECEDYDIEKRECLD